MNNAVYKEYLGEEEKFLKQIERNLQEHVNRLKVEELSLLKLISTATHEDSEELLGHERSGSDEEELPTPFNETNTEVVPELDTTEQNTQLKTEDELQVNSIPLDLNVNNIPAPLQVGQNVNNIDQLNESRMEEEEEEEDSESENDENG